MVPAVTAVTPTAVTPTAVTPSWATALAVVGRTELSRARAARVPLLFVAAFQSLGILLLLRGVVNGHKVAGDVTRPSVVAGATVLVAAFTALNLLAQRLGALRGSGALDRYGVLPVAPSAVVLGTAGAFAAFTLPGALLTAGVGCALYDLPVGRLWILAVVLPLAGAALAGVGALIGLLAPKPELATVLGQLGMSVVLFVGIIPPARLPLVVRGARAIVPASYAVDAFADTLMPRVPWGSVVADLAVCAVVAMLLLALAGRAFRKAVGGR